MKHNHSPFFSSAKRIHLSSDEKGELWNDIQARIEELESMSVRNAQSARLKNRMTPEQFFKAAKNVSLSKVERDAFASDMEQMMQEDDERIHDQEPFFGRLAGLWRDLLMGFSMRAVPVIATVLILVSVGGGAISYAAEESKPGDLLYSMKVRVTEELRSYTALGTESNAEWQLERAKRRLNELQQVTTVSQSEEMETEVLSHFSEHIAALKTRIASLQEQGDTMQADNLLTALSSILAEHHDSHTNQESGEAVISALTKARIDAIKLQNTYQDEILGNLGQVFDAHLQETKRRLAAIEETILEMTTEDAPFFQRKIGLVSQHLLQAQAQYADDHHKKALHYLREARKGVVEMENRL